MNTLQRSDKKESVERHAIHSIKREEETPVYRNNLRIDIPLTNHIP